MLAVLGWIFARMDRLLENLSIEFKFGKWNKRDSQITDVYFAILYFYEEEIGSK